MMCDIPARLERVPLPNRGVRYVIEGQLRDASRRSLSEMVLADLKANTRTFVIDIEFAEYLDGRALELFKHIGEAILRDPNQPRLSFEGANADQAILFGLTRLTNLFDVRRAVPV